MLNVFEEIIGKKFSRLLIMSICGIDKHKHTVVKCKCDCGKITIVSASDVKRRHTKSLWWQRNKYM